MLLYLIVGSGIVVERLSADGAVELAVHAIAVGAGLAAVIAFLAPVSGAHLNPAVTVGLVVSDDFERSPAVPYVVSQLAGAFAGVMLANATFGESVVALSGTARSGLGRPVAEFVATFILVLLIVGLLRTDRTSMIPAAVGAWVAAIVIATVSTGFANPAVTVARMLTDTFAGIQPASAPAFVAMQLVAALVAGATALVLFPRPAVRTVRSTRGEAP
jgi:glycerol uptake facilitator-like aquaporin